MTAIQGTAWADWWAVFAHTGVIEAKPANPTATPSARNEAILLARAATGDHAACDALVHLYQDVWYRFSLSMLGDPDAAAEATQETALRFITRLDRFDGRSTPKTWALGIALNVCREIRRARKRHPTATDPTTFETLAANATTDEPGIGQDDSKTLHRLIAQLPRRQREALVLRHLEQLGVAETARAMRCAQGTVKAATAAGLRNLRQAWEATQ